MAMRQSRRISEATLVRASASDRIGAAVAVSGIFRAQLRLNTHPSADWNVMTSEAAA